MAVIMLLISLIFPDADVPPAPPPAHAVPAAAATATTPSGYSRKRHVVSFFRLLCGELEYDS